MTLLQKVLVAITLILLLGIVVNTAINNILVAKSQCVYVGQVTTCKSSVLP